MSERQLYIWLSPGFLVGLGALLLNDFVLKQLFHNWFTGKLSDFAGLFVFALFWKAVFPRFKFFIHALTAGLFILWKSTYSEPFITAWNSLPLFPIERMVDYTDLIGLIVLPFSYSYNPRRYFVASPRFVQALILVISVFAFTATQIATPVEYGKQFRFNGSKADLIKRIEKLAADDKEMEFSGPLTEPPDRIYNVYIPYRKCNLEHESLDYMTAHLNVEEEQSQTVVTLKEITYRCSRRANDRQELLEIFEDRFISRLNQP